MGCNLNDICHECETKLVRWSYLYICIYMFLYVLLSFHIYIHNWCLDPTWEQIIAQTNDCRQKFILIEGWHMCCLTMIPNQMWFLEWFDIQNLFFSNIYGMLANQWFVKFKIISTHKVSYKHQRSLTIQKNTKHFIFVVLIYVIFMLSKFLWGDSFESITVQQSM